jgi:hypothetical protein
MADLTVGQTLWYVRHDNSRPSTGYEVVVTRVGRKWATLKDCGRIDKSTLWRDGEGYAPPGRCWLSKDAWEQEKRVASAWDDLCRRISGAWRRRPDSVTVENIAAAAALLGIEMPEAGDG